MKLPWSKSSKKSKEQDISGLSAQQLQKELDHENYRRSYRAALRGTIYTLITVSAVAVLVAVLFLPVLRIFGTSMTPTLSEGDIVLSVKVGDFSSGDIVAFYYNNKILVKRVIAQGGQIVDIDADGTVYVDGEVLEEPYIAQKALGQCDIKLPYQVPDGRFFVMGDHRDVSVDSRDSSVGPVSDEAIVGRIVFRVWPISLFGAVE